MKGALLGLLVLAGCAARSPFDAQLASPDEALRACAQWYEALDRRVDAARVRDAQYPRVPGFPYLRTSHYLSSVRDLARASDAATKALSERLLELDLESRRFEIENLPEWPGSRDAAIKGTIDCGHRLREADLADPARRRELLERARVSADDPAPPASPAAVPASAVSGQVVRFAPPPVHLPRSTVAGTLALARLDPLGQPLLSDRAFQAVAATYAPSFELAVAADYDRFGELRWRRRQATPQVEAADPVLYVHPAYTRLGERTLLQVVYTMWFSADPLDGLVWRVTLAPGGEPLMYDAIHPSGRDHRFFRLRGVAEGERPLVRLSSRQHVIEAVSLVHGSDSLVRYALHPYDSLRSLRTMEGTRRSVFGPDGFVVGSALRQSGRLGQFDDVHVIERNLEAVSP